MASDKPATRKTLCETALTFRANGADAAEIRIEASQPMSAPVARMDRIKAVEDAASLGSALTWWDLTEPDVMAQLTLDLFGSAAETAAAWCALTAYFDGREADYRFWFCVFARLGGLLRGMD
ncbi:hypothetical protein [Mesorhizobium sp.]|uniref:hypothetical protein n=1 Tax=Mesorhizobium sp. TaxID=1871066 RepID=UPI000FE74736|nr:hypothetical protein [Mesorhizobium sp.]RWM39405.1 MAG: hypothetical protein EOR75_14620 [Mesorhizobium sp.]TJV49877.1 MAG: hypothetical protein E5Y01_21885 [Mesorhizobium sp.]